MTKQYLCTGIEGINKSEQDALQRRIDELATAMQVDPEEVKMQGLGSFVGSLTKLAGGGEEDHLYQTALALINYHNEYGPASFKMYFGTLRILGECERIIAEGEGSPHPWPGVDEK